MTDLLDDEYTVLRYNRDEIFEALLIETNPSDIFDGSSFNLFSQLNISEKIVNDIFDSNESESIEEKIRKLEAVLVDQINQLQNLRVHKQTDIKQLLDDILSSKSINVTSQLNIYNDIQNSIIDSSPPTVSITDNSSRKGVNEDINRDDFLWAKWSGNKPVPKLELFNFIKPDAINCKGPTIQIPFKPVYWQKITDQSYETSSNKNKNSDILSSEENYNNHHNVDNTPTDKLFYQNFSFRDFMITIPFLQTVKLEKLLSLESEVETQVYYRDQKIIALGDSFTDVFIIRYGTVEVSRPNLVNPLIQESVQFLKSGDLFGFDINFSDDLSNYSFSCFSEELEVLIVPSRLLAGLLYDKTIDNNLLQYIYNECRVRSKNYSFSEADIQFTANTMTFNNILTENRQFLDGNVRTEAKASSIKFMREEKLRMAKVKRFSVLVNIINSEYDFDEIVDEIIYQSKQLLQVDRVGLYIIDKTLNTMILYASQNIGKAGGETKRHNPIRMPLKGVAAHVAMNNRVLNITDAYSNKHFDPSMDLRTGYRTRQMLCIPINDRLGNVVAILQFINPLDKSSFAVPDINLAICIGDLISSKSHSIKIKASLNSYKYVDSITDELKFTINSAIISRSHNHVRVLVSLYVGTKQCGNIITTDLYSTESVVNDNNKIIKRCALNFGVLFKFIPISSLPQQTKICFELFSKNNHPIGYGSCNIFDFNHVLVSGTVNIILWDGSMPSIESRYISNEVEVQQSSIGYELMSLNKDKSILSITFPSFNSIIILNNEVPTRFYSLLFRNVEVENPMDIGNIAWYVNNMTSNEKRKYFNLISAFSNEYLTVSKLDVEACKLILRVKTALCNENPFYIPLVILCTDWLNAIEVKDIYSSIYKWTTPNPSDILQLLDYRNQDGKLRAYSVSIIKQCNDITLLNILYQLVYLLRFEPYEDSSLASFLIRRSIINPYLLGKQFLYYLYNAYQLNQSQLANNLIIANTFLRSVSNEVKTRLLHGMFVLRRIAYNIERVNQTIPSPSKGSSKSPSEKSAKTNILAEIISNENHPKEFFLPLRESSDVVYTGIDNFFAINKDSKTIGISFTSKSVNVISTVLHSSDSDYRLEVLFCQMCKSFDFIWNEDGLDLVACNYESFLIDLSQSSFCELKNDCQSLNNIFFKSIQTQNKSNKASITVTRKISEDMIVKYFGLDKEDDSETSIIIDNFIQSLAANLVTAYVLGIFGVSLNNTFLSSDGSVFLKSPDYILGLQNNSISKKKTFSRVKESLFFLPCFAKVVGDKNSDTYKYFIEIVSSSYMSIRKKSPFIISSLIYITNQIGFSPDEQKICLDVIRDNLELKMANQDDVALEKLLQSINQGLKFDYQISVSY